MSYRVKVQSRHAPGGWAEYQGVRGAYTGRGGELHIWVTDDTQNIWYDYVFASIVKEDEGEDVRTSERVDRSDV